MSAAPVLVKLPIIYPYVRRWQASTVTLQIDSNQKKTPLSISRFGSENQSQIVVVSIHQKAEYLSDKRVGLVKHLIFLLSFRRKPAEADMRVNTEGVSFHPIAANHRFAASQKRKTKKWRGQDSNLRPATNTLVSIRCCSTNWTTSPQNPRRCKWLIHSDLGQNKKQTLWTNTKWVINQKNTPQ